MTAITCGNISAPPIPCTARAPISTAIDGAAPHSAEAAENNTSPAMNNRLRPNRSPSRPPVTNNARNDHPVRIGAQAESPDETFEAVAARQGIVVLSEGNARLYSRPGITARPVIDLSPAELAVAWRASDSRDPIREFCEAAQQAVAACPAPQGQHPDQPATTNPANASRGRASSTTHTTQPQAPK